MIQHSILLLAPLNLEVETLKTAFEKLGYTFETKTFDNIKFYFCEQTPYILSAAGHSKTKYALGAYHAITTLRAEGYSDLQCVCVGCAGALDQTLKIGDILIATQTVEHDFKSVLFNFKKPVHKATLKNFKFMNSKITEEDTVKFNTSFTSGDPLASKGIWALNLKHPFRVFIGIMASGDEDIISEERAKTLQQETSAQAVAWEGAGAALACFKLKVDFLEVRAITDLCNNSTIEDFKNNLGLAMKNLSEFFFI